MRYYSTNKIDKKDCIYNIIFGERSNGKTYALLKKGVQNFIKTGKQIAYVRRWKEDLTGRRASTLFNGLVENGEIEKLTDGEYAGVYYYAGKFYLCNYTDDEQRKAIYSDSTLFAYCFALSDVEHNKSTSYPNITTIVFDEFITNKLYLNDEFIFFMNTVSTIVRQRDDVKIYMLGNTVNKYCPYFEEMGLKHIKKMKQGTIDVYSYGNSKLKVAVEYCSSTASNKVSNQYFAFDNPKLEMITGGAWELNIYPHLPYKYKSKNILLTFFIDFNDSLFQCEIVDYNGIYFIYIHIKTTEIKDTDHDLIYTLEYNPKLNYNRSVYRPLNKLQERILWFFNTDRVFYQNNDVGDAIKNYLNIAKGV